MSGAIHLSHLQLSSARQPAACEYLAMQRARPLIVTLQKGSLSVSHSELNVSLLSQHSTQNIFPQTQQALRSPSRHIFPPCSSRIKPGGATVEEDKRKISVCQKRKSCNRKKHRRPLVSSAELVHSRTVETHYCNLAADKPHNEKQ